METSIPLGKCGELNSMSKELRQLINDSNFRYQSILGLPSFRGKLKYDRLIMDILSFVRANHPTLSEYNLWFSKKCSTNDNVIYNTRKILERANLLRVSSRGTVELTLESEKCFCENWKVVMAKAFIEAYHGMLEILYLLSQSPKYRRQLFKEWYNEYEHTFITSRSKGTSMNQFNRLMIYLINFELISIEDGKVLLNEDVLRQVLEKFGME